MSAADFESLPDLPKDADGPVFAEPWEAEAFALAIRLHEQGAFEWSEWAAALSNEIDSARRNGDPDLGDTYYQHWLAALELLCAEKGLADRSDMQARKKAWHDAYLNTPHGDPVEL